MENIKGRKRALKERRSLDIVTEAFLAADSMLPSQATTAGLHEFDSMLESFDGESRREMGERLEDIQAGLSGYPFASLSTSEKIDLILAQMRVSEMKRFLEVERGWKSDPLSYLIPVASGISYLKERDFAPSEERAQCILERLLRYPELLEEARENLSPREQASLYYAIPVAYGVRVYLEETINHFANVTPKLADRLEKAGECALSALSRFRELLKDELLPNTPESAPLKPQLRSIEEDYLVLKSPEELWEISLEELERAEKSLKSLAAEMWGSRDWRSLILQKKNAHPTLETIRNTYRDSIANAREFASKVITGFIDDGIVRISDTPIFLRIRYPTVSYAAAGGLEKIQETFFWITPIITECTEAQVLEQLREHCYGRIWFIPIHEVYPGHHLQFVCASRNSSKAVRRTRSRITCEGWALYCEELARDLGYLRGDAALFSLEADIWRAARMWVSVGMGSERISRQEAYEMLREKLGAPAEVAKSEVTSSILSSREATGYILGKREIRTLKELYQEKHPGVSVQEFNGHCLGSGCIPPALLAFSMGLRNEGELDSLWETIQARSI